jgi:hypothetical protein
MTETYTMINLIDLLRRGDRGGQASGRPWWEDHYSDMIEKFGGRLFTKQQWLDEYARLVRLRPGYGSRGGKPGYELEKASRSWSWWTNRGCVFAVTGLAV